jgi:hypothetical protein
MSSKIDELIASVKVTIRSKLEELEYDVIVDIDTIVNDRIVQLAAEKGVPWDKALLMTAWCLAGESLFGEQFKESPYDFPFSKAQVLSPDQRNKIERKTA